MELTNWQKTINIINGILVQIEYIDYRMGNAILDNNQMEVGTCARELSVLVKDFRAKLEKEDELSCKEAGNEP